jgi:hypothetical protein
VKLFVTCKQSDCDSLWRHIGLGPVDSEGEAVPLKRELVMLYIYIYIYIYIYRCKLCFMRYNGSLYTHALVGPRRHTVSSCSIVGPYSQR